MTNTNECALCPRMCRADRRNGENGFCGQPWDMRVSRVSLHHFEEPPISGTRGSGTIFFFGCTLRCEFCQNKAIIHSHGEAKTYSPRELADAMFSLRDMGAHNINLVTPTHFASQIAKAIEIAKPSLGIPIVYNTSGYEREETLKLLDGLIDVYLPDFKYVSSELSSKYSAAPNYAKLAVKALAEMYRQRGDAVTDDDGIMRSGVIVRHLVLPSARKDSMAALRLIADTVPVSGILLSLMSQYTPEFAMDSPHKELHRRLTSFEYNSVADLAIELGFKGYLQGLSSASSSYTPDFNT